MHVAPGLGNAMGSLYNAKFTGTPMILTAGQQEQGHGLTEPLLYDPLVPIAAPLVKWAVEVTRLEDLPRIVRRAAKVAMTPPTGPVFISLPGDILNAEAGIDLGALDARRHARAARPTPCSSKLAKRLLAAERPVIIVGDEIVKSDALRGGSRLRRDAGRARLPAERGLRRALPLRARLLSSARSRATRSRCAACSPSYDLMIVLGADPVRMSVWSEVEPLPENWPSCTSACVDWDMGKNFPAEIARARRRARDPDGADAGARRSRAASGSQSRAKAALAELAQQQLDGQARRPAVASIETRGQATPIDGDWLTLQIANALPKDAVVVNEGLTAGAPAERPRALSRPLRLPRRWRRAASAGACRRRSAWRSRRRRGRCAASPATAAPCTRSRRCGRRRTMKLPITYVIANNGGYRIIKQRLMAFHGNDHFIGMDFVDPEDRLRRRSPSRWACPPRRIAEPDAVATRAAARLLHAGPEAARRHGRPAAVSPP